MRSSEPPTARTRTLATRHLTSRSPPAPVVLDRYRLQRRLGAGAFGTVWLARDERLERDVAVKILPRERTNCPPGRFEREARAAARLSHPAIVTLYEAAVDDEGAYLVSELVRGETLDTLLEHGQLSDRDIIAIGLAQVRSVATGHAFDELRRDRARDQRFRRVQADVGHGVISGDAPNGVRADGQEHGAGIA